MRAWPNGDAACKCLAEHPLPESLKDQLRGLWREAWFIDIGVVCHPNPGKMGIGIFARSIANGNIRYAEFAGEGNAAIAAQIAAERAAMIAMSRNMRTVILRSNTKFLANKLDEPAETDKQVMPTATQLFCKSDKHRFIWSPDIGETGMRVAKELATASLT